MITDNTRNGALSNTTVDIVDNGGVASDNVTSSSTVYTDNFGSVIDGSWHQVDHTNSHPSMADIIETGGQMTINAGGADVWTGSDEFAAIYRDDVNGNFDVQVKVDAQENTNAWAKCGIMVRNDMTGAGSASGSGYVAMARTPGNGYSLQYDADGDGYLDNHVSGGGPAASPVWLRLTKTGTTYTGYYSVDGTTWTNHATRTIASADTVQDVGLFVTSHDAGDRSLCAFDDFTLVEMAGTDPSFAFDNNAGTEWSVADEPTVVSPAWIQFALTTPERVLRYTFTTGSGSEDLDPSDWTLYATNDHTAAIADATDPADWTEVDSVVLGGLPSGRNEVASFTCGSPPAEGTTYKYYRFVFTGSKGSTTAGVALAEIEMMTTTDDIPNTADLTDYTVRVQVCVAGMLESNSKTYPNGNHKPIGLLQRHGENDGMYFGLMSGSYTKNTSGGVLRKRIGTITDEIEAGTGQFSALNGIIKTIDAFRIVDFDYGSNSYNSNCGWIATRPINEGECRMWGNPIGEMMYETLRYFSGAAAPTAAFTYADADDNEAGANLSLPKPDWNDPYDTADGGFDHCAKPFMLVLSDINPTFDSDQLPGAHAAFGGMPAETIGGAGTALDVESLADAIFAAEAASGNRFIGQQGANYDGACSEKVC